MASHECLVLNFFLFTCMFANIWLSAQGFRSLKSSCSALRHTTLDCCACAAAILRIPLSPGHLKIFQLFIVPGEEISVQLQNVNLWIIKSVSLEKLVFNIRGNISQQIVCRPAINSLMCNAQKDNLNCPLNNAKAFPLKVAKRFPVQHNKSYFIHNIPDIQIPCSPLPKSNGGCQVCTQIIAGKGHQCWDRIVWKEQESC